MQGNGDSLKQLFAIIKHVFYKNDHNWTSQQAECAELLLYVKLYV